MLPILDFDAAIYNYMRNGIIVCRLSLIKTYLLAFPVLRKNRGSAPLSFSLQLLIY